MWKSIPPSHEELRISHLVLLGSAMPLEPRPTLLLCHLNQVP